MIDKRLTWIRKASNEVMYIMVVDVDTAFVHSSLSRYPYRLILSFINLFRTLVLRWRGVGVIIMEQCVWLLTGTSSALLKMQRCSLLHMPSFLISHSPNCLLIDKYSIASKSQIFLPTAISRAWLSVWEENCWLVSAKYSPMVLHTHVEGCLI